MELNPIYQDPIKIRVSSIGNAIIIDHRKKDILPLEGGCMFGEEYYGFSFIIDKPDKQVKESYPTQCRIIGIEQKEDRIIIYEDGKTKPWKFTLTGEFIECASFFNLSRRDVDYLCENLGYNYRNKIDEVNNKAYQKHI